ncbi:hypothetical protein A7U60_g6964 [Sanghuangporus baumii]|uniref:F-box domain-containing protein n=1 Tax=Sanghuangporus baumii TaxID=108892 RepID=A0A9Q5HU65_SANBA|nr:hypothetical protein A7U60_g6964 [Sanghuangporus baumii]
MENQRDHGAPTLPDELLSLLFREVVSYGSDNSSFLRPERTSAPLNLSWVNSQWRRVSLSTPELWTSIALPSERSRNANPNPNPANGDAELLKLYISRSGNIFSFSFALDYGGLQAEEHRSQEFDNTMEVHIAGMHRLTSILDAIRHRWRITVVQCRSVEALTILLMSLVLGAPLLEHLLIVISPPSVTQSVESEEDNSRIEHILDLARCSNLASVVLQCPQLRLNPFLPDDASLGNLTSLAINTSSSQTDAFTWLQCSPYLEEVSIRFFNAPPFMLPHGLPLTLNHLRQVTLICLSGVNEEPSDPVSFLSLLCLPALRVFRLLMDGSFGSDQGWPHVPNLLRRSGSRTNQRFGPPLEELELLGTPMTMSELLDILELAPRMKSLAIDDALTSDDVLQRLSSPDSSNFRTSDNTQLPMCPGLETLSLHACQASLPVLASMVSSRSRRSRTCISIVSARETKEDSRIEVDDECGFRTLKILKLFHSYKSLPPISECPEFEDCQKDGLRIVQTPEPSSRNCSVHHQ